MIMIIAMKVVPVSTGEIETSMTSVTTMNVND